MRSVRDRAHISELTQRIRDFLARAAATGAVLRASDDREAAQNILDYWNASLLTMRGVESELQVGRAKFSRATRGHGQSAARLLHAPRRFAVGHQQNRQR